MQRLFHDQPIPDALRGAVIALGNFDGFHLGHQAVVGRALTDDCIVRMIEGRMDTATASIAKLWLSETEGRVIDECLQLFGGYGYMLEYPIAQMYLDTRVQRIYGGTSEIMKEVISRAL